MTLTDPIYRRRAAIVAGIASLLMALAAMFAEFKVHLGLVVKTDAVATLDQIVAHESLFRVGVFCFLIVLVCDLLVAWGFWIILLPVNVGVSKLAAWFRIFYTAIFAVAIVHLVSILRMISEGSTGLMDGSGSLAKEVMGEVHRFEDIWAFGLVFFGIHLLFVGYLAWKSGFIPKFFAVLLFAAGVGYCLDNLGKTLLANYSDFQVVLTALAGIPSVLGEMGFAIWLVAKRKW